MIVNKKYLLSWAFFDFANSSYSAVIAAVVFPVYYTNMIVGNESGMGDLWWGRAIALSMALVAFSSPFLGGIADYCGLRKRLLFIYTILGVVAIAGLSLLKKGDFFEGFLLIIAANVGIEGGIVFYNSFLPRIFPKAYQGRVSAWGFMTGYAGSIISLLLALPLVKAGRFEYTWLMVALFLLFFSFPAFVFLPKDLKGEYNFFDAAKKGLKYTISTLKEIWLDQSARNFLISYFVYIDGVNTVIVFSSIFAATSLGFLPQELISLYLIVQTTAFLGSLLIAKPTDYWGPKYIITISLILWTCVSVISFFIQKKTQFWILASIAGLGLGSVQSASRAFFTQFIPQKKEAEYFGAYSFVGKTSAIFGPLIFGYISATFKSQRPAIVSLAVFFLLGLLILRNVRGGGPNI